MSSTLFAVAFDSVAKNFRKIAGTDPNPNLPQLTQSGTAIALGSLTRLNQVAIATTDPLTGTKVIDLSSYSFPPNFIFLCAMVCVAGRQTADLDKQITVGISNTSTYPLTNPISSQTLQIDYTISATLTDNIGVEVWVMTAQIGA